MGIGSELVNEAMVREGQREKIIKLGEKVLQQVNVRSFKESK